jgi:aspartyl protease family protein
MSSSRRWSWLLLALMIGGLCAWGARFVVLHPGELQIELAWHWLQLSPHDPTRWAALGDAQANSDDLTSAELSYTTALRLGSRDPTVHGRLGFLLYGMGRDAAALQHLALAEQRGVDLPMLPEVLAALRARVKPASSPSPPLAAHAATPPGVSNETSPPRGPDAAAPACRVPLLRNGPGGVFVATLQIGGLDVPLIVDTGANLTVIARDWIDRLGRPLDTEHEIRALTANGAVTFPTASLGSVSLGGRRLDDVQVAVCDACGSPTTAGLMGLDLQAAFGVELDQRGLALHFLSCEDPAR